MATPIRIKRSAVAGKRPALADLQLGELALNTVDAELLTKRYRAGIGSDIVRIGAGATVTNIIYVTKDGNDENTGLRIGDAKATVGAALTIATAGSCIRISAGLYEEDNPLTVPKQVSIVGDSLREVSIQPQNQVEDLFYVANGDYFGGMSFIGTMTSGNAIFRFNPDKKDYINQSPYVRDCTNFVKNSIGMMINGNDAVGPFKSMVLDSYTQYNENGIGCSITNEGYAQLVSMFTICPDTAVYVGSGGACDLTNSNSSFGNYGLISDGVGPKKYVGVITSASSVDDSEFVVDYGTDDFTVNNAVYTGATGIVTVTTSTPHNFEVGMGVTFEGLGYRCLYGNYAHTFVSAATNAVHKIGIGYTNPSSATYNPLTGDLALTLGSGHGLSAATSHTISTATYTPTTGVLSLTINSHGFTGSTNHQAVSGTTYNPSTGILTIQVGSHGFAVGDKIKLDDDSLTFTCAKDVHATEHTYPRSTDPASGKWLTIKSTTTNTFDLDVGTSSYTGIHTFVSGTSTGVKKANDHVKIARDSLVFTCTKDANATQHSYPRISDPAYNTWLAIGSTAANTFEVNVGKSSDINTHALVSATTNGLKRAVSKIGIATDSLTFTCDKDAHATNHTYPRAKDPVHDSVIGVESVDSTTATVNVGVSTHDIFPSGKYGYVFEVVSVPNSTSFSVYVGVNTHPHTYVSGGKVSRDVLTPYEGQVVYFDTLYKNVTNIAVGSGGTGYTNAPVVTIDAPSTSGDWGVTATAVANVSGGRVKGIDIVSNGRGYTSTPSITIAGPDVGINTATAVLTMTPEYYAITEATPLSSGISTITTSANLPYAVGVGTTVPIFKQSKILASSHSFEYIGAGVTIGDALPHKGGIVIQDNEIADRNGGLTVFTSTDQTGNFRIGDGVIINQQTGTISGTFYSKSLFSTMTPYILALGGD